MFGGRKMNLRKYFWWISVLLCLFKATFISGDRPTVPEEEKHGDYWVKEGQRNLYSTLNRKPNTNIAKNVILFLGDGMGISTITSMRIYKGQKKGMTGENELLAFDTFPHVSLAKTYAVDRMTPDSANTATAFLCGVKTNYGTLGVDGRVTFGNCESSLDTSTHVDSIMRWAQKEGKWTGLVTSTMVTDATPAGSYANSADRNWQSVSKDPRCKDIAHQLVFDEPGKNLRVILGGGRQHFLPVNKTDVDGQWGAREDSRNLLEEWKKDKVDRKLTHRLIFDEKELSSVKTKETDFLMGLFHSDHLPYVADRPDLNKTYPTLQKLTETAIKILSRNPKGFILLVEGGKIDMAHHQNWALKALEEGVEFDLAVEKALSMTKESETLVVVTADHSHTFSISGDYPLRGTNIVGIGGVSNVDNNTFTILGYHNGPGYKEKARERNVTQKQAVQKDFQIDTSVPLVSETHGAEDVAVYARGPMSHLFHGLHEQSYIPYAMAYAACVGQDKTHCSGATQYLPSFLVIMGVFLFQQIQNKTVL